MSQGKRKLTARTEPAAFGRARLVHLVTELRNPAPGDITKATRPQPAADFAERLGRLFDLSDTLALDDTLRQMPGNTPPGSDPAWSDPEGLVADFAASRDALARELIKAFESGSVRDPLPPQAEHPADTTPEFQPYRRFYQARQQHMATGVQRLRIRLRQALSTRSPALAQLGALDAVFDNTLTTYERRCFGTLPRVLEKRFRQLDREHQETAWLPRFRQEMRLLLLAELEARLTPVQGLLDALPPEDTPFR